MHGFPSPQALSELQRHRPGRDAVDLKHVTSFMTCHEGVTRDTWRDVGKCEPGARYW